MEEDKTENSLNSVFGKMLTDKAFTTTAVLAGKHTCTTTHTTSVDVYMYVCIIVYLYACSCI